MIINSNSVKETQNLGGSLAHAVTPGTTILLNGDLGAGKTTFTQGFAQALGIKRPVKSPTFTLVREYQTEHFMLYHLDVYRLGAEGGAEDLGLSEYFNSDSVALVEWSEFIAEDLPDDVLVVNLSRVDHDETEQKRQIELISKGPHSEKILEKLGNDYGINH